MKTLRLRPASGDLNLVELERDPAVRQAAAILRGGGLVAFPTETVYGLGANALDAGAVEKIFAAKQRPHWDPVIVHVADTTTARGLCTEWPEAAARLAASFWPGPLTLLLPRSPAIPAICTAGREKVGLRMPSHPVARALITVAGVPVAAPSANRFGHTSPTTAGHVLADLDGRNDAVLDAGSCAVGVESTVLDPTLTPATIYRPGGVTAAQIRELLGDVSVAERRICDEAPPESLESPGMGIRHYAPRARLLLVEDEDALRRAIATAAKRQRVGVLLPGGWAEPAGAERVLRWGEWSDPESLARELYARLRALDDSGVEAIVCPLPPAEGIGLAVRDRLTKAAKS
jgi:L-threonylcarbamoyladenylate synthase